MAQWEPFVMVTAFAFSIFRGDRAIEISQAFGDDVFTAFDRGRRPSVRYAGMMQYDGDLNIPHRCRYPPRLSIAH